MDDDPAGADVVRGAGVVARVGGGRGVLHGERRSLGVVRHRDAAIRVVVDHALVVVPWVGKSEAQRMRARNCDLCTY